MVVTVRDLDAAAAAMAQPSASPSRRAAHTRRSSAPAITRSCSATTIVELLGILTETEQNKPTRDYLATREGLERAAFTTDDAAAGAEELKSRGFAALGPIHFGRPVELPGGGTGEAKFNVFRWPLEENPGSLRIFACQHLTRDTVWIPNCSATPMARAASFGSRCSTADPKAAAQHLEPPDRRAGATRGRWLACPSGGKRADFLFYDAAGFARRYPDAVRDGAATEGAVALVVGDQRSRRRQGGSRRTRHLPMTAPSASAASAANGIVLSFLPQ